MLLDDGDRARLARIERQLAGEDPELARALDTWRPVRTHRPRRMAWALFGTGILFAVLALVLGSVGWATLAALTGAGGWYWLRTSRPPTVVVTDVPNSRKDVG